MVQPSESMAVHANAEQIQELQKPKIIPKALPEDVKEVILRWNEILVAYGQPGENMLSQAKNILSDQGGLLLQFTNKLNEDFFLQNDAHELQCLKQVIQNIIGKEVEIETRTVDEKVNREYEDISHLIHFEGIEYQ